MGDDVQSCVGSEVAWCLSLVLRLGAFLVVACAVTELLRKVLGPATLALIDVPILSYIATHRVAWLTAAMREITRLGSDGFLWVVVIVAGSILRRQTGSWRPLLILVAMAVGAYTIEKVVKPSAPGKMEDCFGVGVGFPLGARHAFGRCLRRCCLSHFMVAAPRSARSDDL